MDYYETLGVPRNASQDDIRGAFRRLAMEWHPDTTSHNYEEATKRMSAINDAWAVLGKPSNRLSYDRYLREKEVEGEATFESWFQSETYIRAETTARKNDAKTLQDLLGSIGEVAVQSVIIGVEATGCLLNWYSKVLTELFLRTLCFLATIALFVAVITLWDSFGKEFVNYLGEYICLVVPAILVLVLISIYKRDQKRKRRGY